MNILTPIVILICTVKHHNSNPYLETLWLVYMIMMSKLIIICSHQLRMHQKQICPQTSCELDFLNAQTCLPFTSIISDNSVPWRDYTPPEQTQADRNDEGGSGGFISSIFSCLWLPQEKLWCACSYDGQYLAPTPWLDIAIVFGPALDRRSSFQVNVFCEGVFFVCVWKKLYRYKSFWGINE